MSGGSDYWEHFIGANIGKKTVLLKLIEGDTEVDFLKSIFTNNELLVEIKV